MTSPQVGKQFFCLSRAPTQYRVLFPKFVVGDNRLFYSTFRMTKDKPLVLLTGEIDWAHDEWNSLSDVATLKVCNLL